MPERNLDNRGAIRIRKKVIVDPIKSLQTNMIITSIDIGIQHLGLVKASITKSLNVKHILDIELVDIQEFHPNCKESECPLQWHNKCFADWIEHVIHNHSSFFSNDVSYILIERQPPLGLVAVEQLIMSKFRTKAHLIHPRSTHSHFNCTHLDYEGRKKKMEEVTLKKIIRHPHLYQKYKNFERQHDVADALCQMIFFLSTLRKNIVIQKQEQQRNKRRKDLLTCPYNGSTLGEFFKMYEYKKINSL
jgi:hypothetical protein